MSWTALCQPSTPDSVYCLPLSTARLLVGDAMRLQTANLLVDTLYARVHLLELKESALYDSYTNLLNLSEQKYEKQKEITADVVRLSDSWRDQSNYYQKRYKKARRGKKIITYIAIAALGWAVVK